MNPARRHWLAACGATAAGLLLGVMSKGMAQEAEPQLVKIVARKFNYTPNQITLKTGQAILEFTAIDFVHGFSMPDLNVRADLIPGKPVRVMVNFEKAGRYDFLCDNFCGDGHEGMNGSITVV